MLDRRTLLRMAASNALFVFQDSKSKEKDEPTVYTPGGDVKAPKVIHYVEPQFSASSKEAFVEGVVKLKTTVTPDGLPTDIGVTKGLNADEDRTAVEAVKQWRFQPGTKGGEAVHVRVSIEIAFHLM
jgi:TonB family protein